MCFVVAQARRYIYTYRQAKPSDTRLFRSRADSFAHGTNLKLQQANARAQAEVARASAWVWWGLATPLSHVPKWGEPIWNMAAPACTCALLATDLVGDLYGLKEVQ